MKTKILLIITLALLLDLKSNAAGVTEFDYNKSYTLYELTGQHYLSTGSALEIELYRNGVKIMDRSRAYTPVSSEIWKLDITDVFIWANEAYNCGYDYEIKFIPWFYMDVSGFGDYSWNPYGYNQQETIKRTDYTITSGTISACYLTTQYVNFTKTSCDGTFTITASTTAAGVTVTPEATRIKVDISETVATQTNKKVDISFTCSDHPEWSQTGSVTLNVTGKPGIISTMSGSTVITTFGVTYDYGISASANASAYEWEILPVESYTSYTIPSAQTLRIYWNKSYNGTATIKARGTNSCGDGEYITKTITVSSLPTKATKPTGVTTVCQNGGNQAYTTSADLATSYQWAFTAAAGTVSGTGTTGTVDFTNTFSGTGYLTVRGVNSNGVGEWSDALAILINPIPGVPVKPTGTTSLCQNSANTTYTTNGGTNASSYVWDITPEAGSITGTGTNGTVDWSSSFASTANVKVKAVNGCGESAYSASVVVTVNPIPTTPATPTGVNNVCQGGTDTYTTTGGLYATSKNWVLTPSTSGIIRTNGGNTVTIDWSSSYTGEAQLKVQGVNSCGVSAFTANLDIHIKSLPLQASTPTGQLKPCQGTTNLYSSVGSTYASSYEWKITPTEAGIGSSTGTSCNFAISETYSGTAQIQVRGINDCGVGVFSDMLTITISPKPSKPAKPTGALEICQGTSTTAYTTTGGSYCDSYEWTISDGAAGSISGVTKTGTMNWNTTFVGVVDISVRGINTCGEGIWSDVLTVERLPLPTKAGSPSGTNSLCQGTTTSTYTTSGSQYAETYEWIIEPSEAATLTGFSTNVTVNWNQSYAGTANLKVRGINSCGQGIYSDYYTITINPLPSKPETPTGETKPCQGGEYIYSTTNTLNSTAYNWEVIPLEAATVSGVSKIISIEFSDNYVGPVQIRVRGDNGCGYGPFSEELSVEVSPLPSKAAKASGNIDICQGTVTTNYTTNGSNYAESYAWDLKPVTSGSIVGSTKSATVNWNNSYVGDAKITVKGVNSCGEGQWADTLEVEVNPLPSKAGTPMGTFTLCQASGSYQYTTTGALYSDYYEWVVEPTTAGTITGVGTNVSLIWASDYSGIANIKVRGVNGCGNGVFSEYFAVTVNPLPNKPETPTGETNPCQGGEYQYSTTNTANTLSYIWEVIPTEAGTVIGSAKTVSVKFSANYSGIVEIRVSGDNNCGIGEASESKLVTIKPKPSKASKPSGMVELCENVLESSYATTGSANATSYSWNISPLTAGSIVGSTNNAVVYWTSNFVGEAYITVNGINDCGIGEASDILTINRRPLPSKPNMPNGENEVCQNIGDVVYTINAVDNATALEWKINPLESAEIIGTGTSITLRYNDEYSGTSRLSVRGVNSCGEGVWSDELIIIINSLPIVQLNDYPTLCSNGNEIVLSGGYPTGGSYEWLGVVQSKFDPKVAGIGDHTIRYTYTDNNSCTNFKEKTINVLGYPSIPEIDKTIILSGENYIYGMAGQSLQINIKDPSESYYWYNEASGQNLIGTGASLYSSTLPNSVTSLAYWVKAFDGNCYSNLVKVSTKSVIIPNTPFIIAESIVCKGDTVQYTVNRDQAPSTDYIYKSRWYDKNLKNIHEGDTLELPYNEKQRIYLATVDSVNTGIESFVAVSNKTTMEVDISTIESINIDLENEYCKYSDVNLTATSGANTILWYNNLGEYIAAGSEYTIENIMDDVTYYVAARNNINCLSEKKQIDINMQELEAKFNVDVESVEIGGKVKFTNTSLNSVACEWSFGDGSDIVYQDSPEHYFYEVGEFDVKLIVKSNIECKDTLLKENYIMVIGTSTGIKEKDDNNIILVYPNPVIDKLNVNLSKFKEINKLTVKLYDLTGKVVLNEQFINKALITIQIPQNVSSGMYLLELSNENFKFTERIIKK